MAIVLDAFTNGDLREFWRRYFVEDFGCEVKLINCTTGYTANGVELREGAAAYCNLLE